MEILWEDLSQTAEETLSPAWHAEVLAERERLIESGQAHFCRSRGNARATAESLAMNADILVEAMLYRLDIYARLRAFPPQAVLGAIPFK